MAEKIREVIARMKQNSQTSKPTPAPAPKPAKVVKEEIKDAEDDYVDEEETLELDEEKPVENVADVEKQDADVPVDQRIAMEIEMLQNNGRYRVELLHQLQEINKALVVIAGVLVDLSGKNDKA